MILASARKESDTEWFVNQVFEDIEIKKLDLLDYNLSPFNYSAIYPHYDQFQSVVDAILSHRIIIFATPVYWYAMSGLLKTMFDRFTDLVTVQKETGQLFTGKSVFLIAVGSDKVIPPGFEEPFSLTSKYLRMFYKGSIYHSTKSEYSKSDIEDTLVEFRRKVNEPDLARD